MRCPHCRADNDKVVDSRPSDDAAVVRRRRECLACGNRFTTYERVEEVGLVVRKRSGQTEPFDRAKLLGGIELAVRGSNLDASAAATLATAIEDDARARGREVTSEWLGRSVLERLRELDPVSYLRFASVYKEFDALSDFEREVFELQKTTAPKLR